MRQAEAQERPRLSALLLAGALAIALALAGCGGDDEPATAQVSKAAFLEQGDAICDAAYKRVQEGFESFTAQAEGEPFSDIGEIEEFADTVLVPAKQAQLEELEELGIPRGDEDKIEAILAAYEEGIEKAEENPRDAVVSSAGVFVTATDLARDYGLKSCRY